LPGAASDCSPREQPREPARRRRAGIGRTRFFLRYARSIAPWLHPPGWLFDILINAFLDQARTALARPLLQPLCRPCARWVKAAQDTGACDELWCRQIRELSSSKYAALRNRGSSQCCA